MLWNGLRFQTERNDHFVNRIRNDLEGLIYSVVRTNSLALGLIYHCGFHGVKSSHFFVNQSYHWASLVAQWLRICLPMQETWVWALVPEDPTCRGATKPVRHNYWACALEPTCHNYWACALEPMSHNYWACTPRACAPQQEKPLQWEARAPQRRVAPARHN